MIGLLASKSADTGLLVRLGMSDQAIGHFRVGAGY